MLEDKKKRMVESAVDYLSQQKKLVTPVDVLMDMSVIKKSDYDAWRQGEVEFLEKVMKENLRIVSFIMKEIKKVCLTKGLKPIKATYKQLGENEGAKLRFSKSGNPRIEEAYTTHYIK